MSAPRASSCPPRARGHTSRPRRAASRATRCGCWSPRARTGARARAASATCPSSCAPATCSSSTPRRRCPPRVDARRADGSRSSCTSPPSAPTSATALVGRRAAHAGRRGAAARRAAPASALALAGGGRARAASRRTRGGARLWLARAATPARRCASYLAATAARSATATCPRDWPLDAYQTVFAAEPGQRRDAERRPPVHARARHAARRRAASLVAPLVLHTGVSSPEAHEPPYPERYARARGRRRGSSTPPAAGAAASSPSARPSCARWRPSPTEDGTVHAGARAGPTGRHARARPARRRRPAHRLARAARPRTSQLLEAVAGAGAARAQLRARRSRAGYLWHEFGDSHLILP